MSNKYDANEHIKVLAEINTLLDVSNETQIKINALRKQLEKIDGLKKEEDEIPYITESENMKKQQFDIGTYFTIKYYADKHSKTITRRGQFTKECEYGNHKVHGFPYFKYFDVDANGIRCASKSWKISEVANVK